MLKHEDIMKLNIVKIPEGTLDKFLCDAYVYTFDGPEAHLAKTAFTAKSVAPDFVTLFQASPLLYRVLVGQQQAMKNFENLLRAAGQEKLAAEFADVYGVLQIAIESATKGVEHAHKQLALRNVLYTMQNNEGKTN